MLKKLNGFNLFELLITLLIIGILATLSVPLYFQHFTDNNRLQAELNLIEIAEALEQYYSEHNSYQHADLKELGFDEFIANKHYKLTLTAMNNERFLLRAIPMKEQAKRDAACGTLSLDNHGKKGISGSSSLRDCW